MISELKTFIIKCDGCGKTIKCQEFSQNAAIPKDWHTEKTNNRYSDGYLTNSVQSTLGDMLNNQDKHYCEGCHAIKDIIE